MAAKPGQRDDNSPNFPGDFRGDVTVDASDVEQLNLKGLVVMSRFSLR